MPPTTPKEPRFLGRWSLLIPFLYPASAGLRFSLYVRAQVLVVVHHLLKMKVFFK